MDLLKEKHRGGKLVEFYRCLPTDEFLKLKKFAAGMASMFGRTDVFEQTFPKVKNVKSEHRTQSTNEYLMAILLVQCSNTKPKIEEIMKNHFINRTNHLLNFALLFSFRFIDFLDLFNIQVSEIA